MGKFMIDLKLNPILKTEEIEIISMLYNAIKDEVSFFELSNYSMKRKFKNKRLFYYFSVASMIKSLEYPFLLKELKESRSKLHSAFDYIYSYSFIYDRFNHYYKINKLLASMEWYKNEMQKGINYSSPCSYLQDRIMNEISKDIDLFNYSRYILLDNDYPMGLYQMLYTAFSSEFILREEKKKDNNNFYKPINYSLILSSVSYFVNYESQLEAAHRYIDSIIQTGIDVLNIEEKHELFSKLFEYGRDVYVVELIIKVNDNIKDQNIKEELLNVINDELFKIGDKKLIFRNE